MGGQKKFFTASIILLVVVVLVVAYVLYGGGNRSGEAAFDYKEFFDLNEKSATTRIYISSNLGLGFTYDISAPGSSYPNIRETEYDVQIGGQAITVFSKPAGQSLEEAVRDRFLSGVSANDCFVSDFNTGTSYPGYVAAAISFPLANIPNASTQMQDAWRKNAEKCPREYSLENGNVFFLMNPLVPDKFVFVREGWNYSAASSGLLVGERPDLSWTRSLRIFQ